MVYQWGLHLERKPRSYKEYHSSRSCLPTENKHQLFECIILVQYSTEHTSTQQTLLFSNVISIWERSSWASRMALSEGITSSAIISGRAFTGGFLGFTWAVVASAGEGSAAFLSGTNRSKQFNRSDENIVNSSNTSCELDWIPVTVEDSCTVEHITALLQEWPLLASYCRTLIEKGGIKLGEYLLSLAGLASGPHMLIEFEAIVSKGSNYSLEAVRT